RDEGSPVTDSVSGWHFPNQRNACLPGHCRTQNILKLRQWRNAIKQHARSNDFESLVRELQDTGRLQCVHFIIAGSFSSQIFDESAEAPQLVTGKGLVLI